MSLKNINSFPRFSQHLVAARAFAQKPLVVVDVGARGGFEEHWSLYGNQVKLIGFEADAEECERLNQQMSNSGNQFFPVALHQNRDRKTFYLTAYPPASGFYPVDTGFWHRFVGERNLSVVKTLEMGTVDFDSFASENNINYVDFMKLDTEGSELDILKGAVSFLKKSVMGLSVEVEFLSLHKGQPIFSDVDLFLGSLGFRLYDLAIYRDDRKALPVLTSSPISTPVERGQVISGQALYLRDVVGEIESASTLEVGWDVSRVLKMASIMELFCLPDCAIEVIQLARQKELLEGGDVAHLIDMLVPGTGSKSASYNEYMENLRVIKNRGYVGNIEHGRQLSRRFLPAVARRKIFDFLVKLRDLINEVVK